MPHRARVLRLPLARLALILHRDHGSAIRPSCMQFESHLSAVHLRRGQVVHDYDLGSGLVTHAGVRLLSQDTAVTAGTAALAALKYHGTGTGTTAATDTDTALETAIGTTATSGTNANADDSPNATVTATATVSYSGDEAVTEWGLFNQSALSGATMWDHKVFSAINVTSGDTIEFTYTLTLTAGG